MLLSNTYQELSSMACEKALAMMFIPLFAFFSLLLLGRTFKRYRGVAATFLMFVNTVIALLLFLSVDSNTFYEAKCQWIKVVGFEIDMSIYVDSLSALFALIVCFVSFLVHLFSIEYLRGDKHFEQYFSFLGLFTFAMLGIIFSGNLLQLFVFWELVGFSSYLLIGFWFQNPAATLASKKAFIVNRIGDVGFLMGILILFGFAETLNISVLSQIRCLGDLMDDGVLHYAFGVDGEITKTWLIVASLGIASGALAKSAQFPFSVWLPNAMEGPTPVSALIHAATMVAAGIYLLARFSFMMPEIVLDTIAIIGTLTAVIAAVTAITQTDIKKVLAYSTISQLGYMVMSIGVQAYDSALFHLLTHAFFKAALFLCAGAIIHSLHKMDTLYGIKKLYPDFDEQNMNQMGGMRKKMPIIFWVYTIALCGIIGVPFFTGFLSKDAILLDAFNWAATKSPIFYLVPITGLVTVGLTAFYMTRQWFLVFFGENRLAQEIENAPRGISSFITKERLNAPFLMKIPPIILAVLTLAPVFSLSPFDGAGSWVYEMFPEIHFLDLKKIAHTYSHTVVSILSLTLLTIGVTISYFMFQKGKLYKLKDTLNQAKTVHGLSYDFWHLDALFQKTIVNPTMRLSKFASNFDKHVIDNVPHALVLVNKTIARTSSRFDAKIIDGIVKGIGVLNVIFAHITAWLDYFVIDGIVRLIALIGMKIGGIAKIVHKGKVQDYMVWSFIFMILVFGLIYWIY